LVFFYTPTGLPPRPPLLALPFRNREAIAQGRPDRTRRGRGEKGKNTELVTRSAQEAGGSEERDCLRDKEIWGDKERGTEMERSRRSRRQALLSPPRPDNDVLAKLVPAASS